MDYPMIVPYRISKAANSGDMDALLDAFRGQPVIREWNLVGYDGEPLPTPDVEPESLYKIPAPLMGWVLDTIAVAAQRAAEDDGLGESRTG